MKLILILLLFILPPLVFADVSFKSSRKCQEKLFYTFGGLFFDYLNGHTFLPAKAGSKKGFYMYGKEKIYFCQLPAPSSQTKSDLVYTFELKDGFEFFMKYSESKHDSGKIKIGGTAYPPDDHTPTKYASIKCAPELSDASIKYFNRTLLAPRLKEIKSTYEKRIDAHKNGFKFAPEELEPQMYKDTLETCKKVDGLTTQAEKELAAFAAAAENNSKNSRATIAR